MGQSQCSPQGQRKPCKHMQHNLVTPEKGSMSSAVWAETRVVHGREKSRSFQGLRRAFWDEQTLQAVTSMCKTSCLLLLFSPSSMHLHNQLSYFLVTKLVLLLIQRHLPIPHWTQSKAPVPMPICEAHTHIPSWSPNILPMQDSPDYAIICAISPSASRIYSRCVLSL
jgi:hypothetical protein